MIDTKPEAIAALVVEAAEWTARGEWWPSRAERVLSALVAVARERDEALAQRVENYGDAWCSDCQKANDAEERAIGQAVETLRVTLRSLGWGPNDSGESLAQVFAAELRRRLETK